MAFAEIRTTQEEDRTTTAEGPGSSDRPCLSSSKRTRKRSTGKGKDRKLTTEDAWSTSPTWTRSSPRRRRDDAHEGIVVM